VGEAALPAAGRPRRFPKALLEEGLGVSRSLSRVQAVLLGVAVCAGLAVAGVGLFAVGSRQWLWGDSFHVRVGFRRIQGVEVGTRVRVLGRAAGEVEAVELPANPSGEITLLLRLDGRVRPLVRADAVAQIVAEGMVGGKVIEIDPGSDAAAPVADNSLIASRPATDLTAVLDQVNHTLHGIADGRGSLGRLVKDDEAYRELIQLIRQGRGAVASLKQNADALKGLPVVRSYVRDPLRELVRPDCERNRQWFAEADLFEPGHAVLTAPGRQRLDELVPWLEGLKHKGSEVVVAGYAAPGQDPDVAQTLTQKQSEAVCEYLTGHHAVQKLGWFTRRRVTPLGCGVDDPPLPEPEPLPRPRVEVVVFVPQS
jgi:phospholipid/cholesterol/gamma-HCH transport system substrate-binding protein